MQTLEPKFLELLKLFTDKATVRFIVMKLLEYRSTIQFERGQSQRSELLEFFLKIRLKIILVKFTEMA